jgi:hypothetical protein
MPVGTVRGVGQIPLDLAERLANELSIRRAVETGTFLGDSTRKLIRAFATVETIELSARLARRAQLRFLLRPSVTVRHGKSAALLRPAREPTLYWLDAHWSGGITAGEEYECPLLDELRATSPGTDRDCYLVDDAALFTQPPPRPHKPEQWPSLQEIKQLVRVLRPGYSTAVVDDVIAIVPSAVVHVLNAPHQTS